MTNKIIPINLINQKKTEERITWANLKAKIEAAGVNDQDYIDTVDISWGQLEDLVCYEDEVFGWQIKL
ncbi:MAG: hypothetical protein OEX07_06845 [Gammaproteobacteria bacterium]|nr:hypothetical protein [Gammaproteobacteria bacterium]